MAEREKGRKDEYTFSSRRKYGNKMLTKLPPKNYLYMNEQEQIDTPNLINIYRQEYKSKHFQFGTAQTTEVYREEVEKIKVHCNRAINELQMTGDDLQWIGDEMQYNEDWPMQSEVFRIAQLNVNGLSFAKDNFKIDMYLQSLMASQVDVATIQEINLNLNARKVREKFITAMKRYDQRATTQLAYIKNEEKDKVYRPGGNAVWNNGVYTGRIKKKGQDKYGRWAYTILVGKKQQELMIISAYNTCEHAAEDGGTIAGQLRRALRETGKQKQTLRNLFYSDLQDL
jgi:hypothetical protein